MADHFYGVNQGGSMPGDVTVGTSTTSDVIELRLHDGVPLSKIDVLRALEALTNYIATNNVPA